MDGSTLIQREEGVDWPPAADARPHVLAPPTLPECDHIPHAALSVSPNGRT